MTDISPQALSVAEAAAYFQVTPEAIRKRLQRGTLHGNKINGTWTVQLSIGQQDTTGQDNHKSKQDTGHRLSTLETENALLLQQLADIRAERDAWREQAQQALTALANQQALSLPAAAHAMQALPNSEKPHWWGKVWATLTRRI